jgi:hypothetical protein
VPPSKHVIVLSARVTEINQRSVHLSDAGDHQILADFHLRFNGTVIPRQGSMTAIVLILHEISLLLK